MIISLQVAHQVTNNMRYQRGKDKEQIQAMKQELESATEQLDEVIVDRENNANHSKRLNATNSLLLEQAWQSQKPTSTVHIKRNCRNNVPRHRRVIPRYAERRLPTRRWLLQYIEDGLP